MSNIFIYGLKSKTGGGKSILHNYLKILAENGYNHNYIVLTPDKNEYDRYSNAYIQIIDIKNIFKNNISFLILNKFIIPGLIKKYQIDCIVNFGDIVIPVRKPQLYLFDWSYAVYPDSIVWKRMDFRSCFVRKIKLAAFKININRASRVIAQTQTMKTRLETIHGLNNVELVPNPVTLEAVSGAGSVDYKFPLDSFKLLYLTHYYPHKNLEILIPLARKVEELSLPYSFIITIDGNQHKMAQKFINKVKSEGLDKIIINIGNVDMGNVASLYSQCDVLFMPTLIESYGLPYVEAMYNEKPILTSDFDFSRDVCGDAGLYFDPLDVQSIISTIEKSYSDQESVLKMKRAGKCKIENLPDWETTFRKYHELVEDIL